MRKKAKKKLDPHQWYTLTDLVNERVFPWIGKDIRSYRRFVANDRRNGNHLKPVIIGDGRLKRYSFKGQHIIRFIEKMETGSVTIKL